MIHTFCEQARGGRVLKVDRLQISSPVAPRSSHLVIYYVSQDSIRSPGQVSTGIYRYLQVSSRLVEVSSRLVEYTALLIETTSILSRVR